MLLSASRDKTLIVWNLTRDESQYGYPKRSLHGHSYIVSDCVRLSYLICVYTFPFSGAAYGENKIVAKEERTKEGICIVVRRKEEAGGTAKKNQRIQKR